MLQDVEHLIFRINGEIAKELKKIILEKINNNIKEEIISIKIDDRGLCGTYSSLGMEMKVYLEKEEQDKFIRKTEKIFTEQEKPIEELIEKTKEKAKKGTYRAF